MRTRTTAWLGGLSLLVSLAWASAQPPAPPDVPKPPSEKNDEPPPPVVPAFEPVKPMKKEMGPPADTIPVKPAAGADRSYTPPTWRPADDVPPRGYTRPSGPPEPGIRMPETPPVIQHSPPAAGETEKTAALIELHVPAGANIWIGSQRMTQTGPVRLFQSPPIERGRTFFYTVRFSLPSGAAGQAEVVKEQEVRVHAGQTTRLDLNPPTPTTTTVIEQPIIVPVPQSAPPVIYPRYIEGSGRRR